MFLAISIVLGLVAGLLLKRDITRLVKPGFYGIWLPICAFGLEFFYKILAGQLGPNFDFQRWYWIPLTVSYGAVVAFCLWNLRHWVGASLFMLGTALNFLVIGCNGWRMPVSEQVLALAGMSETGAQLALGYFVARADAVLLWLGDIFFVPIPYVSGFMSIGDMLLCVALMVWIPSVMRPEAYRLRHGR